MTFVPTLPSAARATATHALNLLFPPRSLDDTPRDPEGVQSLGMTAGAWSKVHFIEAPFCDGCGAPFEYDLGVGARLRGVPGACPCLRSRPRRLRVR